MKHPTDEEIEKANPWDPTKDGSFLGKDRHDIWDSGAKWARDQQPKLKTLEWLYSKTSYGGFASAATPFLTYEVINDGTYYSWGIAGYAKRECESIYHGKQLAQAEYEKRVNELYV